MTEDAVSTYKSDPTTYNVKTVNDTPGEELYLVFSKTATDNLPITTTKVESTPCIDPDHMSEQEALYPVESEKFVKDCQLNQDLKVKHDPRYTDTGGRANEYDVQSASGVLSILEGLNDYQTYVPDY